MNRSSVRFRQAAPRLTGSFAVLVARLRRLIHLLVSVFAGSALAASASRAEQDELNCGAERHGVIPGRCLSGRVRPRRVAPRRFVRPADPGTVASGDSGPSSTNSMPASSRCTEAERRGSGSTPVRGLAATADVPRRSSPVLRRRHTRLATRRAVDPAPVAGTRSGRGRCRAQAASPVTSAQCGSVRPHWVGSDALFTSRLLLWFCASPFHGGECGFSCGVTVAGRCSRRAGDSGSSPGGRPGRRCWRGMIFRLAPGVGMVGAGYEVAWTAADRS